MAFLFLFPVCFVNPLYTSRLFHCYILDESIFHVRGARSFLSLCFYSSWKILLANKVDPDQMPHYAYDPFTGFPVRMG